MIRLRYLRYRNFNRLRHSQKTLAWLAAQAARLAALTTGDTTFDNTTNTVTQVDHIYTAGTAITLDDTSGTLPAELSASTTYYVGTISSDTFKLYPTAADAVAETNVVAFTDDGSATVTATATVDAEMVFNHMRDNHVTFTQLEGLTSIL